MVFTEPRYLLFFVAVFALFWALRGNGARKGLLLVASYAFYSAWDWRFSFLLLATTLIDFVVGLRIDASPDKAGKRRWLVFSLVANLGVLGFFKYWNFFIESAADLTSWLGISVSPPVLHIVLPVGVSFYTFQSMSYALDVYRGHMPPTRSLLDFTLFVAFFPQLVAGPIVRAADFVPQLEEPRRFAAVPVQACIALFLIGYVKKACIADHFAPQVDAVFLSPSSYSTADAWLGLLLYHAQIYCDFSGYSDMALASAGLLGYTLLKNFDFPYFARNVPEFWRRWHISLSTWLRDYLYISLGGSRASGTRTLVNLYVTFALCGLWHGAAWNFIVFGFMHATYCVVHALWRRHVAGDSLPGRVVGWLAVPLTNLAFMMSLVVFRATDWDRCGAMFGRLLGLGAEAPAATIDPLFWLFLGVAALAHWVAARGGLERLASWIPRPLVAPALGAAWAIALFCAATKYQPFVYFQF